MGINKGGAGSGQRPSASGPARIHTTVATKDGAAPKSGIVPKTPPAAQPRSATPHAIRPAGVGLSKPPRF